MLSLDVACGNRPRGSVNVDLNKSGEGMRYSPSGLRKGIPWQQIPNFIIADQHYLPFKSNIFDLVINWSSLEFVENPLKAICEMLRVCKDKLEIYVPHRLAQGSKNWRNHYTAEWFQTLFRKLHIFDVKINLRLRRFPPLMPYGIDIAVRLHKECG